MCVILRRCDLFAAQKVMKLAHRARIECGRTRHPSRTQTFFLCVFSGAVHDSQRLTGQNVVETELTSEQLPNLQIHSGLIRVFGEAFATPGEACPLLLLPAKRSPDVQSTS